MPKPKPKPKPIIHELWWLYFFYVTSGCVKLLLIPSYHSTDLDVHHHWLTLTHTLPVSKWYVDTSSIWTLDYPPLFAYFQLLLSYPFQLFSSSLLFLRLSVILSDLLLAFSLSRIRIRIPRTVYLLVLWAPGLLLVDHVHFQYNGVLLGVLVGSLAAVVEGRDLEGAVWFAVLVCSKHLFAVAAPVYGVYLLRRCCWGRGWDGVRRGFVFAVAVAAVVVAAFGPFVYYGQMKQVLQRLFPFGRGLVHAYWAPNFWVFYIVLDKGLTMILRKMHFNIQVSSGSFTGGLVGDSPSFSVLPQVTPTTSLVLVLLAMIPCLVKAWKVPHPKHIIRWVAYAYTCGFLFGWHVHEKASLHFVIPLGLIAIDSFEDAQHYFLLAVVSCYSMFPLIFEPKEYPIKVLLLVIHSLLMYSSFCSISWKSAAGNGKGKLIGKAGKFYLFCLFLVEIWGQFLHPYILGTKLPFLPLMLVSVSCALGMFYSWIWQLRQILKCN